MAFLFVPINTIAYVGMAPWDSNQVSGLINLMRNVGGSIGISAVTTMIARRQQVNQVNLICHTYQYHAHFQQFMTQLTHRFSEQTGAINATQRAYGQIYGTIQRQAAVLASVADTTNDAGSSEIVA